MKVIKTKDLGNGHKIEIGNATWDSDDISVRNRYHTSNGGFSPRSSSEIPLNDVSEIIKTTVGEDLIDDKELVNMIIAISESLKRKLNK